MLYPTTGIAASNCKLFFYEANSSDKQNTYTTAAGTTPNDNPITLNAYGRSANQIWLIEGRQYKIVIAPSTDTDPPASGITIADYVTGINDSGIIDGIDQWVSSGLTPTYVSATQFTLSSDQTTVFHVGRRLKTTNTGGSIYSTITASSYSSPNTTITVVNDSGTLDSGLSVVYYAVLSSVNPSIPKVVLPNGSSATTQTAGDSTTNLATTAFVAGGISTATAALKHNSIQDFRLTLTTAVPVTTGDVTGATTIYCTPYTGNRIGLYNGSTWDIVTSAEFSLALGTITNDQGYDVFAYNNNGVATLEFTAWTSNTARATALVMQDGILCKTGALTRRYLGSFLTTATTTTEDSDAKRYLFNYYHRQPRRMRRLESTATWSYNTSTFRQGNNSTSNQLNFFIGVLDQFIPASLITNASNSGSGNKAVSSLGLNSTSTPYGITAAQISAASNRAFSMTCNENILPILGKNYISWLEWGDTTGTLTWIGVTSPDQSGLTGVIQC